MQWAGMLPAATTKFSPVGLHFTSCIGPSLLRGTFSLTPSTVTMNKPVALRDAGRVDAIKDGLVTSISNKKVHSRCYDNIRYP